MGEGLRIRDYGVHPKVRNTCVDFARWLRREICFPRRLVVCLHPAETLRTQRGDEVLAAFFAPTNGQRVSLARVAAGAYPRWGRANARHRALIRILDSFAHEIVHYEQWRDRRDLVEQGVVSRVRSLLRRYRSEARRPRKQRSRHRPNGNGRARNGKADRLTY